MSCPSLRLSLLGGTNIILPILAKSRTLTAFLIRNGEYETSVYLCLSVYEPGEAYRFEDNHGKYFECREWHAAARTCCKFLHAFVPSRPC